MSGVHHDLVQAAGRAKALTLQVCTTGTMDLAATTTGYARATGSFISDGFEPGMQITPLGFVANTVDTILAVATLTLTTKSSRSAESSASGRSITVGLPSDFPDDVEFFEPSVGVPWAEEVYLPGPQIKKTLGTFGQIELEPQYGVRVHVPAKMGTENGSRAARKYADALCNHFAMNTTLVLDNTDVARVRGDVGPFPSSTLPTRPGFVGKLTTFPLRLLTQNTI